MNTSTERRVRAAIRMALALSLFAGCKDVTGVDLSWSLEELDGRRVDNCLLARVDRIRLYWEVEGVQDHEDWPCDDSNAVTRQDVPPGDAFLWVEPICIGGVAAHPASYEAPAKVARHISRGEVITLNTVLIMVDTDCDSCTSDTPCSQCCICANALPGGCMPDEASLDAASSVDAAVDAAEDGT
jgi:hypothetical protein